MTAGLSRQTGTRWLPMMLCALAVVSPDGQLWAATFTVDSTNDEVDASPGDGVCASAAANCTLRAAVQEANALAGTDTITIPAGTYTSTLVAEGNYDITEDLTISGAGDTSTIIDGGALDRVIAINSAVVDISGVTIRNGNTTFRGAGILTDSTITLTNVIITGNVTTGQAGGIRAEGAGTSLTMIDCTVSGNSADNGAGISFKDSAATLTLTNVTSTGNIGTGDGGGIRVDATGSTIIMSGVTVSGNSADRGAGIQLKDFTTADLENVTVSGNTAATTAGGIRNETGTTRLTNVTVTANSAPAGQGGGIAHAGGLIRLLNTIVAANPSGGDCTGTITSLGNNLDSDGSCGFALTAAPVLGGLQDNGGSSFTHELLAGSPAIDAGTNTGCPATDQRGVGRPVDGDGDLTATCDIGAFEAAAAGAISGIVYEDVNGDASLGDAAARGSVTVSLYLDDGDSAPDAGDTLQGTTTTDGSGSYSFASLADARYWVVADAKTLSPSAGLNVGAAAGDLWAEQTYGSAGALCADGTGGTAAPRGTAGACFGGRRAGVSDDSSGIVTAEHLSGVVVVGGAGVNGIDFGFSYNVVTTTRGGDGADDDGGANRSIQGAFLQFVENGNAIAGGNAMRFVPAEPTNAAAGGHTWWRVTATSRTTVGSFSAFAHVLDADLTIDGQAYDLADGISIRDTNTAAIGLAETVGVDGLYTTPTLDPELEVLNDRAVLAVARGIHANADRATVRRLAISGFSVGSLDADIFVGDNAGGPSIDGVVIEDVAIGTGPASNADPGAAGSAGHGVFIARTTNGILRRSLIRFVDRRGVHVALDSNGWLLAENEFNTNGIAAAQMGLLVTTSTIDVNGNLIAASATDALSVGSDATVDADNNTFRDSVDDGISVFGTGIMTATKNIVSANGGDGVVLGSSNASLSENTIQGNTQAGVLITTTDVGNNLSRNVFGGNGGIAIDLVDASAVRGITANSGTPPACGYDVGTFGNDGLDYPVISAATTTTVSGTACAGATVQVYRAVADPDFSDNTDTVGGSGTDHGEGALYLGQTAADGVTGAFSLTGISGLSAGDAVSVIAIDGSGNTSEFSANVIASGNADLTLTKTDSPDPAPLNGPLLYTLLVTNNGPATATNVTLTDTLPASVTLVSATPTQGSCAGAAIITCNLGSILNGGTASVEILVTTSASGTITNSASVSADEPDPVPADNAASEDTDVVTGGGFDVPLTQFRRVHGFIDYQVTGGSLRTQPNGGDPCAIGASSSDTLSGIPGTATITEAYLYWAGSGSVVDGNVTLDATALTADRTFAGRFTLGANDYDFFGGIKDVTALVAGKGNGVYSFSGLTVDTGNPYCAASAVMGGWALYVIYEDTGLSGKTLVLYDGFDIERNGSTSYVLSGIYATAPVEARTTALLWEGDESLGGVTEQLQFNGVAQSDGLNPVNNVYNSTINSLGSSTVYGMDLDTFDVSPLVNVGDTLATTQVDTGPDLVILNAVVLQVRTNIIVGSVFEDVNYGGGPGRDLATAEADAPSFPVRRPNATVELYDTGGNFLRTTVSDAAGLYGFTGLPDGDYQVRIVNDSVGSSRPGATGSEWAVQTFRTDASGASAASLTTEIGGAAPAAQDAPANLTSANLATLTAQSVAPVTISAALTKDGVDFGYNFDTVANTNDTGQGSLRSFIDNANALTNANLDQDGLTAGTETSLFMIPSDADPLGRPQDPGFDAGRGVAVIAPASVLPAITDVDTHLDATTQTASVGNTNAALLGTGGTVGVDAIVLGQVAGPEVEMAGGRSIDALDIDADDTTVRGLSIWGFNTSIDINAARAVIEQNVLGTPADSFTDQGAARSSGHHIRSTDFPDAIVRNNLLGFGGVTAISASGAAGTDWEFRGNEFRSNALESPNSDAIAMHGGNSNATIEENLIVDTAGFGIDLLANAGNNTIRNNTLSGNGHGNGSPGQTGAIRVMGSGSLIERNVITSQQGAGIHVAGSDAGNPAYTPAIRNTIARNHFGGNGSIAIDLIAANGDHALGDGPTLNDGGPNPTFGNEGLDYPALASAVLSGANLRVTGTVQSGADVEIYVSDADPSGFGEGIDWIARLTEGSPSDNDPAAGAFDFTVAAPAVSVSDAVTAIALLEPNPGGFPGEFNTSEFSGNVTIATDLALTKRAFLPDGTPIPDGTTLPNGLLFHYLIYINNPNGARSDVSVQDVLDPAFGYESGTLRVDNSVASCAAAVCTPAEEAAILAAAAAAAALTDAVDADVARFDGSDTIDVGNENAANTQLDIAANRVWAMLFSVRMQ